MENLVETRARAVTRVSCGGFRPSLSWCGEREGVSERKGKGHILDSLDSGRFKDSDIRPLSLLARAFRNSRLVT